MSALESSIGQVANCPFVAKNGATGQASSFVVSVVKEGVLTSLGAGASVSELASGAYNVAITFSQAGNYVIITDGQVIARVIVFDTSTRNILSSILDGTMGSWRWDKVTGTYTLYGISGQVVAAYDIEDTVQFTSRQRTS